jgi:hypothetical protein
VSARAVPARKRPRPCKPFSRRRARADASVQPVTRSRSRARRTGDTLRLAPALGAVGAVLPVGRLGLDAKSQPRVLADLAAERLGRVVEVATD